MCFGPHCAFFDNDLIINKKIYNLINKIFSVYYDNSKINIQITEIPKIIMMENIKFIELIGIDLQKNKYSILIEQKLALRFAKRKKYFNNCKEKNNIYIMMLDKKK